MNLHEQAFVESFVRRPRRERALLFLADPKKRRKFAQEFAHHGTYLLEPSALRSLEPGQQNPKSIYSILRKLGAPDSCHLISEASFDDTDMELLSALENAVGYGMGTVISCVPGRLGYSEAELRERYILQK